MKCVTSHPAKGQATGISVCLKAPQAAGIYQGFFSLCNHLGEIFGAGGHAIGPTWV